MTVHRRRVPPVLQAGSRSDRRQDGYAVWRGAAPGCYSDRAPLSSRHSTPLGWFAIWAMLGAGIWAAVGVVVWGN